MSLSLHTIQKTKRTAKTARRVGRGNATGNGTYAGRGLKGQRSRSGGKSGLVKRAMKANLLKLPKYKGFKSHKPVDQVVNLSYLEKAFPENAKITVRVLHAKGAVESPTRAVKVLGHGNFSKKLVFGAGLKFSKSAQEKIVASGSVIEGMQE